MRYGFFRRGSSGLCRFFSSNSRIGSLTSCRCFGCSRSCGILSNYGRLECQGDKQRGSKNLFHGGFLLNYI